MNFRNYENALQYGAKIIGSDIDTGTIATSNLANSSVTGVKLSTGVNYCTIAVGTKGTTVVNVFGSATAPIAGTVTGFWTIGGQSLSGTSGTVSLWGTTMGTLATISSSATSGTFAGTAVLTGSIATGDTVFVQGIGGGTCTAVVTFQATA